MLYVSMYIEQDYPKLRNILMTASFILMGSTYLIHLIRSFVVEDFKRIGVIRFNDNFIQIEKDEKEEKYEIEKISNLHITYGGFKGKMQGTNRSFHSHSGSNNKIKFRAVGQEVRCLFLVENKNYESWLHNYFDYLISNGIELVFNNSDNFFRSRFHLKGQLPNFKRQ